MKRLQISVDISGRQVFVVGEDNMAAAAVENLLPCGCSVTVISMRPRPEWEDESRSGKIRLIRKPYSRDQIMDAGMVFACAETEVNHDIYAACRCLGIPVFTEGEPAKCDFFPVTEPADPEGDAENRDLRMVMSLQKIRAFDLLIFTSPAAVRSVFREMRALETDIRILAGRKIAAAGRDTAESLQAEHLYPDFRLPAVPAGREDVESLFDDARRYFRDRVFQGSEENRRILVFGTEEACGFFTEALTDYRTDCVKLT